MSSFAKHEYMYSKPPLSNGDNRDENFLIDALGTWIPECELLYYGLLNSHYSEILYKLKHTSIFDPHSIYLDTCFFSGDDLIRYLASPDDNLNTELSDDFIADARNTAFNNYFYVPCSETMIRHSIIELAYYDFVKSINIIYPWDIREMDFTYAKSIIPHTIMHKFKIISGNIIDYLRNKNNPSFKFTSIISNSIDDINYMIDHCEELHTDESFFLLRNHSGNTKFEISEDLENSEEKKITFNEIGSENILDKLMDADRLIPKTKMRFARYEPLLFNDARPKDDEFFIGN